MRFRIRTAGEDARYYDRVAQERERIRDRREASERKRHRKNSAGDAERIVTEVQRIEVDHAPHNPGEYVLTIYGLNVYGEQTAIAAFLSPEAIESFGQIPEGVRQEEAKRRAAE